MKTKISFVGGGNIARAILRRTRQARRLRDLRGGIDDGNRRRLKSAFGDASRSSRAARDLPQNPAAFVLAIKPQERRRRLRRFDSDGGRDRRQRRGRDPHRGAFALARRARQNRARDAQHAGAGRLRDDFCCAPDLDAKARAFNDADF